MAIRKPTKDEARGLARADFSSTYEVRTPIPTWGDDGELVEFFQVSNNKDRVVLYANTKALGLRAPDLYVTTSVDVSLKELDQLIGELKAIREDLVNEDSKARRLP